MLVALGARERRFVSWPLARDGLSVGACFAAAYAAQVTTSRATHTHTMWLALGCDAPRDAPRV